MFALSQRWMKDSCSGSSWRKVLHILMVVCGLILPIQDAFGSTAFGRQGVSYIHTGIQFQSGADTIETGDIKAETKSSVFNGMLNYGYFANDGFALNMGIGGGLSSNGAGDSETVSHQVQLALSPMAYFMNQSGGLYLKPTVGVAWGGQRTGALDSAPQESAGTDSFAPGNESTSLHSIVGAGVGLAFVNGYGSGTLFQIGLDFQYLLGERTFGSETNSIKSTGHKILFTLDLGGFFSNHTRDMGNRYQEGYKKGFQAGKREQQALMKISGQTELKPHEDSAHKPDKGATSLLKQIEQEEKRFECPVSAIRLRRNTSDDEKFEKRLALAAGRTVGLRLQGKDDFEEISITAVNLEKRKLTFSMDGAEDVLIPLSFVHEICLPRQ